MSAKPPLADGFHVSDFIQEELDFRGWTRADLANAMGMDRCVRNMLVLDVLFIVGPANSNCRLGGDTAERLGRAFGTSADLFLNLERAWLNMIPRTEGE